VIDDEATAYHEAGHYVAARAMGLKVEGCSTDGRGNGVTRCFVPGPSTPETRRATLSMLFGGLLAELMHFGHALSWRGHEGDHRAANELLRTLPTQEERIQVQREAMDAAARALLGSWPLVQAIAEELLEYGSFPRAAR
jgi:ATP-dependent Zn protease